MEIYLDFDGTIVEHFYPKIGEYNSGAIEVINKLQKAGHKIILNTVRVEFGNETFELALNYLNSIIGDQKITAQNSTKSKITPCNWDWELFKAHQVIYIDDICSGIPLKPNKKLSTGKMVDWAQLDIQFVKQGIY